jgi:hypothetical protein
MRAAVGSVAARSPEYLQRCAVRDFRNAFSHANWRYNTAINGLECGVLEDARNRSGTMRHFDIPQSDLNFWQALSRGVVLPHTSSCAAKQALHPPGLPSLRCDITAGEPGR